MYEQMCPAEAACADVRAPYFPSEGMEVSILIMLNRTIGEVISAAALILFIAGVLSGCKGHSSKTTLSDATLNGTAPSTEVWHIGRNDNSGADLALGPDQYKDFLSRDFGYEDRYFLVGLS